MAGAASMRIRDLSLCCVPSISSTPVTTSTPTSPRPDLDCLPRTVQVTIHGRAEALALGDVCACRRSSGPGGGAEAKPEREQLFSQWAALHAPTLPHTCCPAVGEQRGGNACKWGGNDYFHTVSNRPKLRLQNVAASTGFLSRGSADILLLTDGASSSSSSSTNSGDPDCWYGGVLSTASIASG